MRWWWPAALPALALLWTGGLAAQSAAGGDDGGARALILRALERAAWYEEQNVAARYRARMTKEVRRFDRNGGVRTRDVGEYEVAPIDGVPFERRLTFGDRPLNAAERSREDQREAAFREELRRSAQESGSDDSEEDDDVVFNAELVARYVFTLEEEERFRNRPSYRIAFEPRPGRLPVRRRIDYALNKARGRVWIDRDTYEPARVEFELIDRVRLWWGMLGTIRHARGSLDRGPVLGGVWARIQFEIYSDVRVVFRHTRRAEFRRWRDFEFVEEADQRPPPAP